MFALVFAGLIFAQAGSPIVQGPQPPPITVNNNVTLTAPPMDPQAVSDASTYSYQSFIVSIAQPVPVDWVNSLCGLPDLWRTTPANLTYGNSAISGLATGIGAVASGLLAVAILAQGLGRVFGQQLALGRVVFAFVLSFGN